jgi:hypothetical protein
MTIPRLAEPADLLAAGKRLPATQFSFLETP